MKKFAIVWDFDGTILPIDPFDSEQYLLTQRMTQPGQPFGWFKNRYSRAIIYADQHQRLRRTFKMSYMRLLKGTPSSLLDDVSRHLAEKISLVDRNVLWELNEDGFDMMVLSCGTADLSERVLKFAGIYECFSLIEGNRFHFEADRIVGMDLRLPDPEEKLSMVQKLNLSPERTMVIGDGYTDFPLLNWSALPVIIDRSGKNKNRLVANGFYFISAIPEITRIIEENITPR